MKAGVVGIGYIGVHHLRNLHRLYKEGYIDKLYAVDIDIDKKIYADMYKADFYSDYKKLINSVDLDFIILSVPTKYHYKLGIDIIRKGINMLIEKPITLNPSRGYELIREAKENNILLTVGHIERFNPIIKVLMNYINEGVLGDIISMSSRRLGGPRKTDIGITIDLGIHDIDIMRFISGKDVKRVYSYNLNKLPGVSTEDYASIILEFEDGIIGNVEVSRLTPVKIRELNLVGTKNFVSLDYIRQRFNIIENFLKYGGGWKDFKEFISKYSPRKKVVKADGEEPLYIELKETIEAIEKKMPPPVPPEDAVRSLEIAYAALKSSSEGYPVEV